MQSTYHTFIKFILHFIVQLPSTLHILNLPVGTIGILDSHLRSSRAMKSSKDRTQRQQVDEVDRK